MIREFFRKRRIRKDIRLYQKVLESNRIIKKRAYFGYGEHANTYKYIRKRALDKLMELRREL